MRTTSIMKKPSLKFLISIAAITVISIGVSGALTAPKYKIAANAPAYDYSKLQKEKLGRGVVAIRENQSEVAVSWRYLSSDPVNTLLPDRSTTDPYSGFLCDQEKSCHADNTLCQNRSAGCSPYSHMKYKKKDRICCHINDHSNDRDYHCGY